MCSSAKCGVSTINKATCEGLQTHLLVLARVTKSETFKNAHKCEVTFHKDTAIYFGQYIIRARKITMKETVV